MTADDIFAQQLAPQELAAAVQQALREAGIDTVLAGGAVICIYIDNPFGSQDLDLVTRCSVSEIAPIMKRLGFERTQGRYWGHPKQYYFIEFPAGPLAVGETLVTEPDELVTKYGIAKLLSPTDAIKDRLAAYFHWNDAQSFEQALLVYRAQKPHIDLDNVRRWAKAEGSLDKFKRFLDWFDSDLS